jgi:CheY-like chemotaxis protein
MSENSSSEKKTILVVDDSWITRQFLTNFLALKNYLVLEAGTGQEALKILEDATPDCIILDVLMPDLDGIETLKIMKEKGIKIPTIMLTADIQSTTKAQCIRYGAESFINKPAKDTEIMIKIEAALKK